MPKTTTKAPDKKPAAKAPAKKTVTKAVGSEPTYTMPKEVKDWIDNAMSRLRHMQSEIDRLKTENRELKAYRRFAEDRILRSEAE